MIAEKDGKLPELRVFEPNIEVLSNYYINVMDSYLDEAYDVKNWVENNSFEDKFTFLSEFCKLKDLNSEEEKEVLHETISDWRIITGDKIADYILTKKATENLFQEEVNSLVDIALSYNQNCVEALKLKVDYYSFTNSQ